MQVGIIGLASSGKSTVFSALVGPHLPPILHRPEQPAVGAARISDPRLEELSHLIPHRMVTPAEITYYDVAAAPKGTSRTISLGPESRNILNQSHILVHVVRVFEDETVAHPEGSVSSSRDVAAMDFELVFSDLDIILRRIERIEDSRNKVPLKERPALEKEEALLRRLAGGLEKGVPLREQDLAPEDAHLLRNYALLTVKPLLIVMNVGESLLPELRAEEEWSRQYSRQGTAVIALCGKLEKEIAQLEGSEVPEFQTSLGIDQLAPERVIRACYQLAGLITFYTVAHEELRAWPIPRGTTALKAAGSIHSDMERGFIRAEVVSWTDLARCGSWSEARKKGVLRVEGKGYTVQDGDVITFLFNV